MRERGDDAPLPMTTCTVEDLSVHAHVHVNLPVGTYMYVFVYRKCRSHVDLISGALHFFTFVFY